LQKERKGEKRRERRKSEKKKKQRKIPGGTRQIPKSAAHFPLTLPIKIFHALSFYLPL
jgi:hypothetical protein